MFITNKVSTVAISWAVPRGVASGFPDLLGHNFRPSLTRKLEMVTEREKERERERMSE